MRVKLEKRTANEELRRSEGRIETERSEVRWSNWSGRNIENATKC